MVFTLEDLCNTKIVLGIVTIGALYAAYNVYKFISPLIEERKKGLEILKRVAGPRPHWLLGHLDKLEPTQDVILKVTQECATYPKMGQLWFGPIVSYLMLYHPHVVKPLLKLTEPKDNMAYRFIRPWIGDGLLVSSGKKWHRNRHLLTRAFHFDILKQYAKVFNSCIETMLKKWSAIKDGTPVEMFEHVSLMTLDNMLQCAISCKTNCQNVGSDHTYISAVYTLTTIAMKRVFNPLCHNDFIFSLTPNGRKFKKACDYIHEYDEQVINERKSSLKALLKGRNNKNENCLELDEVQLITSLYQKNGKSLDFLDILLLTRDKDGKGLSDREIRDEVDTFLFEGHDTTASGISWAFYCLATYPKYQEKCREEVRKILEDKDHIEWDDLSKMTYLTMFIKEVLRLYPPVFAIARRTENPVTFPRGFAEDQFHVGDKPVDVKHCSYTVQSPYNISVPIVVLHRNETVWNDPQVFDPSRFSVENSASRSPYAYLPFSAGPRNCIGQNFAMGEMKIAIAKVLRSYRLYTDKECPAPVMMPMIVLKSTNGIYIKMAKL
ncbi:unnamed protein product [Clavelina lepadiformis]|uniref:Cytochrome P450 n=1 Tax=Clavelina lepadiformis TaxID=159417 RepID=A0ABP0F7L7_CLALP